MIHLERVRCSGGLLDLVRTFHGMYRRLGVVHLMSLCFPAFRSFFSGFSWGLVGVISWWDSLLGITYEDRVPLCLVILPLRSLENLVVFVLPRVHDLDS
jgi:hypothetical protein